MVFILNARTLATHLLTPAKRHRALAEAESRWLSEKPAPAAGFVVGDLGDATLGAKCRAAAGVWAAWADVCACHFALHYACGAPERGWRRGGLDGAVEDRS